MDLNDNLSDPQWNSDVEDINFFGQTPEIATGGEVIEVVEKDDINTDKGKDKPATEEDDKGSKKEEEEEVVFDFSNEKPTEKEKSVEDNETHAPGVEETPTTLTTAGTLNFLKDKGLVEVSDEELQDLTEEDAELLLEDKFNATIERSVNEKIAGLPPVVKQLIRLAVNNGDVESALADLAETRSMGITTDMDIALEANQEKMLRYQLASEDYEEDEIDAQIEFLKDSGKLSKMAERVFNKWKKDEEESQEERVQAQKTQIQQARQRQIDFKKEVTSHLTANQEINNFPITKKDLKDLPDYVSTPTVKTANGAVVTPFWNDLTKAMQDKDKLVILAKIVKDDFKFEDLERKLQTRTTSKIKDDLQRKKETIPTRQGSSQTPKSLIDLID